jgi:hypothetical protein
MFIEPTMNFVRAAEERKDLPLRIGFYKYFVLTSFGPPEIAPQGRRSLPNSRVIADKPRRLTGVCGRQAREAEPQPRETVRAEVSANGTCAARLIQKHFLNRCNLRNLRTLNLKLFAL